MYEKKIVNKKKDMTKKLYVKRIVIVIIVRKKYKI